MGSQVFSDLKMAMEIHKIPATGIVHVGAHLGEEVPTYLDIGFRNITLVEPNPWLYEHLAKLQNKTNAENPNTYLRYYPIALGVCHDVPKWRPLYMCSRTQEWSMVETAGHFGSTRVTVYPLCNFRPTCTDNVLVIDVQGSELDVLKSDDPNYKWDMIICEIDRTGRYPGVDPDAVMTAIESRGMRVAATYEHDQNPEIKDVMFVKYDTTTSHP